MVAAPALPDLAPVLLEKAAVADQTSQRLAILKYARPQGFRIALSTAHRYRMGVCRSCCPSNTGASRRTVPETRDDRLNRAWREHRLADERSLRRSDPVNLDCTLQMAGARKIEGQLHSEPGFGG